MRDAMPRVEILPAFFLLLIGFSQYAEACLLKEGQNFYKVITVYEEQPIGSDVGSLGFQNTSSVKNVRVITSNKYFSYNFTADSFIVEARIDLDLEITTYQGMTLMCDPHTGPSLEIEVEFDIKDINDHSPRFRPSAVYNFSVSEAAVMNTQVGIVEARDADKKNVYLIYELVDSADSKLFQLKTLQQKAVLSLVSSLDYEDRKSYSLSVIAKDCQNSTNCSLNQRTSTAEIIVQVTDADDLSPEFLSSDYRATIFEDAVQGTVVVQAVAKDGDELNEPVLYSLSGQGSQYFKINEVTGLVTVFDRSGIVKGRQYLLQIKAHQINDESKKATTSLVIKIVATNGNAPQLSEDTYRVSLSESSPLETSALTITATDRDTDDSDSFYGFEVSQLEFKFIQVPSDGSPFYLRALSWNSAEMVLNASLDYESVREYQFTVQVSDGEYMDTAKVIVSVLNENDHNPIFTKQTYSFQKDWELDAVVGTVQATDLDQEDVTYSILPPYNNLFSINNKGEITLPESADKYTSTEYLINIQAQDSGASPRTTTVVVKIELLNIPTAGLVDNLVGTTASPSSKDRVYIYIVSAVAAVLLILVVLLVLYFFRRKAKKTAHHLKNKKDVEQREMTYTKPFSTESLASSTLTQTSYHKDTLDSTAQYSEDQTSQTPLTPPPVPLADKKRELELPIECRRKDSSAYNELEEVTSDEEMTKTVPTTSNNLSRSANQPDISDTEQEYQELSPRKQTTNNNIPVPLPHLTLTSLKSNSDSGRSSLRGDRSPYLNGTGFTSFQAQSPGSSVEDNGNSSQDEEVIAASNYSRPVRPVFRNTSANNLKPDVRNVRVTEGPAVRNLHQHGSGLFAEAPEGFRTDDSSREHSPVSNTSDYSSTTPTHEMGLYGQISDYPTISNLKYGVNRHNSDYSSKRPTYHKPKRQNSDRYVHHQPCEPVERSTTPDSVDSHETQSTVHRETNPRPQMTIYF